MAGCAVDEHLRMLARAYREYVRQRMAMQDVDTSRALRVAEQASARARLALASGDLDEAHADALLMADTLQYMIGLRRDAAELAAAQAAVVLNEPEGNEP